MHRFALTGTFLCLSAVAFAQSPNLVVEEVVTILDKALSERRDELEADSGALYTLLDDILRPRFDQKYAAQLVLARNWRTATPEQRVDFTEALYASLLRRYASGILEFDASRIDVLTYRGDETKKRTTVKTIVTLDNGTKTPVNYVLVKRESGWLIFDVVIEGISYIRNYRVEMNEEVRRSSLDAVIARLQSEVETETNDAATGDTEGETSDTEPEPSDTKEKSTDSTSESAENGNE